MSSKFKSQPEQQLSLPLPSCALADVRCCPLSVVLLGEGRVGKTCLCLRYVQNSFSAEQESTIQATFLERRLTIGRRSVVLNIWDTAGQERFHALGPIYYRDSHGALLVYDITDRDSFTKGQHAPRRCNAQSAACACSLSVPPLCVLTGPQSATG